MLASRPYLPSGRSPAFALLLGPRTCNLIFGWSGASGCLGRGMVCPLSQSAARQIVPDELPDRSNSGAGDKIAAFCLTVLEPIVPSLLLQWNGWIVGCRLLLRAKAAPQGPGSWHRQT